MWWGDDARYLTEERRRNVADALGPEETVHYALAASSLRLDGEAYNATKNTLVVCTDRRLLAHVTDVDDGPRRLSAPYDRFGDVTLDTGLVFHTLRLRGSDGRAMLKVSRPNRWECARAASFVRGQLRGTLPERPADVAAVLPPEQAYYGDAVTDDSLRELLDVLHADEEVYYLLTALNVEVSERQGYDGIIDPGASITGLTGLVRVVCTDRRIVLSVPRLLDDRCRTVWYAEVDALDRDEKSIQIHTDTQTHSVDIWGPNDTEVAEAYAFLHQQVGGGRPFDRYVGLKRRFSAGEVDTEQFRDRKEEILGGQTG